MASEHSLDISAKIDLQAFKDAIAQAEKEVIGRYDFKGITYEINYREKEKQLILLASSDNKLDALKDIVDAGCVHAQRIDDGLHAPDKDAGIPKEVILTDIVLRCLQIRFLLELVDTVDLAVAR